MSNSIRQHDLEAYLDEGLPADAMARVEDALRSSEDLRRQVALIQSRRDSGVHSLGEIWRRHRLSCPHRQMLGSYLLGTLATENADYVRFHLEVMNCRYCQANLSDLQIQQREALESSSSRRRRFFQSSAGLLRHVD